MKYIPWKKYFREALDGYVFSLLAPVAVSLVITVGFGNVVLFPKPSWEVIPMVITTFAMWSFIGLIFSGFYAFAVGVPFYCLLRALSIANIFTITAISAAIGYVIGAWIGSSSGFGIFGLVYGFWTGIFFWYGSRDRRKLVEDESPIL